MRTSYFRFGQLRQERGEKHLRNGELVTALNVRQTSKAGVYQKRRAFTMTSMLFSGATWGAATPVSCVTAKDGVGHLMRDSSDRLWSYDGAAASPTWTYRGSQVRAWADSVTINPGTYTEPMPCSVDVGSNVWSFARKGGNGSTIAATYDLVVTDKTTGRVVATQLDIAGNGVSAVSGIMNMSACYDGTNVWLLYVTLDGITAGAVYCRKFVAATPTVAPTGTTYYSAGAGLGQNYVACQYNSGAGVILVAHCGMYNGTATLYHSILDPATGAAKVAPGVQTVVSQATNLPMQGLGFISGQETDGTVAWYHYYGFQNGGSGATYAGPVLVKISDLSTLAYSVANGTPEIGTATDVITGAGVRLTLASTDRQIVLWSKNGRYLHMARGTTASSSFTFGGWSSGTYAGCWLASGIAYSGDYIYFVTGFDDVNESAFPTGTALVSTSTQRTFHLRRMATADILSNYSLQEFQWNWQIIAHVSNGLAAGFAHTASSTPLTMYRSPATRTLGVARLPSLIVSGTKIIATLAADAGVTGSVGISRVEFDLSKEWGKDCSSMGKAIGAGSIPVVWSKDDNAHEISPLHAPPFVYKSGSAGASEYATLAVVYNIRDADGTVWRSSPYLYATAFGVGSTFQIPMLRHMLYGTTANIEIYLGTTATPKLQTVIKNFQLTAGTGVWDQCVAYVIPATSALVDGESLYTLGGGLSQTWPPQCQAVGAWRGRVFLATGGTLWASQEYTEGLGLLFNEDLRSTWTECQTDINQIKEVDYNYLALISDNGAAVIDGPGPDSLASGNYSIKTLKTKAGCSKTTPTLSGPGGCYFQDSNTGRVMLITQQLQVVECAGGAYDYSAQTVSAAFHCEDERSVGFMTTSGNALVIDYQHPTEAAMFGQVHVWTPATIAYAAGDDVSGIYYLSSLGNIYRQAATYQDHDSAGAATDYRMKIKTAPLQLSDLQGEFDVAKVQVLGKYNAACSAKITTYPDYATSGTATTPLAFSAAPFQLATKPPSCMRIQAFAAEVEETAGTGAAFDFEGFAVEWMPRGHMKNLNTSQVI